MPHGRIDVHGHLLPGLDDGSRSVQESVEMARLMADAGYTHITCSPHIWPGQCYKPAFIQSRVASLQSVLDGAGVPITLVSGGELNITELDLFDLEDEDIPTYGMAGKYVLFDFWAGELPHDYWTRIDRLKRLGATPIQAHPERIMAFQNEPELLDELAANGVLLQGNLQCFTERAGSPVRRCVERWLREGRYYTLGSDMHRVESLSLRIEGLQRAIDIAGDSVIDRLTRSHAAYITGIVPIDR